MFSSGPPWEAFDKSEASVPLMRTPSISSTVVNNSLRVKTSITLRNYGLLRDPGTVIHGKGHKRSFLDKLGFSELSAYLHTSQLACVSPGVYMQGVCRDVHTNLIINSSSEVQTA